MKIRTSAGRLRSVDAWLAHAERSLLSGPLIDFGFGLSPVTTQEWAATTDARVIGIDRKPHPQVDGVELHVGGAESCAAFAPITIVRAMNVLRGYQEQEVEHARVMLGAPLIEGGVLVEGSTDIEGHVMAAWILRKRAGALLRESLLMWTDFSRGFSPWLFRDVLPRDVRRNVKPGSELFALFTEWEARCRGENPRERFESSIAPPLLSDAWERANGFVRWSRVLPEPGIAG